MRNYNGLKIGRNNLFAAGVIVFLLMSAPLVLNAHFAADDIIVFYLTKSNFFPFLENWSGEFTRHTGIPKPEYFFRPLYSMIFKINTIISGHDPRLHVFTNVLTALLSLYVFYRITEFVSSGILKRAQYSFKYFFLLLLYPPLYYNIAWISGKADLLIMLFSLCSSLFAFKYIMNGKRIMLASSLLFYVSALLTKDNGILFFPAESLIIYVFFSGYVSCTKYRNTLFLSKLILTFFYIICRLAIPGLLPPFNDNRFDVIRIITVSARSLAEFVLPMDSGQTAALLNAYTLYAIIALVVFLPAAAVLIFSSLKNSGKKTSSLIVMLLIPLTSFAFYIFEGRLAYRFYISGFAFFLLALSALDDGGKSAVRKFGTCVVLLFFAAGSVNVIYNWIKCYRTSDYVCSALSVKPENGTELIILNYPHSFNNSLSVSDLGYYVNFVQHSDFEKPDFIKEGACMSLYSPSDPEKVSVECRMQDSLNYVLKLKGLSAYFYPVPFYDGSFGNGASYTNNDGIKITSLNSLKQKPGDKIRTDEIRVTLPVTGYKRKVYYFTGGRFVPAG